MLSIDELCEHLTRLLHTPTRRYDAEGNCVVTFCDQGGQQDPLMEDSSFLKKLRMMANPLLPTIYCELGGALYGIVQSPEGGAIIVGPSALPEDSRALARAVAMHHGLDPQRSYCISHNALNTFSEGVGTIFHYCTGINLSWDQMVLANFQTEVQERLLQEKMNQVCYNFQSQGKMHNPYGQEQWEQDRIRCGDVEGLKKSFQEPYVGQVGLLSHDPVRQARNIAIVLVTLSTRSAIEGGVPAEISFSLSDAFIQHIEELNQPVQIYSAARQMEIRLAKMVGDYQNSGNQSSLTIRCKREIYPRMHQKIIVKELAQSLGVTPDYLSHVFAREEGISLTDYIAKEKICYAQRQLIFTKDSYKAIAYTYGFSSQSHFGKVFKKWTGVTPRQYREYNQLDCSNMEKPCCLGLDGITGIN